MGSRNFSNQLPIEGRERRDIDSDAPNGMRLEILDNAFQLSEQYLSDSNIANVPSAERLYRVLIQSMGLDGAPGNPFNGFRDGAGKQLKSLEWPRAYDLISRWWSEWPEELRPRYRELVNDVLRTYRIVWDLGIDGSFHRVLPVAVENQVDTTFQALNDPRFKAALSSFEAALHAYDDRPQRGRDTCKNAMDALESIAKVVFAMPPTSTFGDVLTKMRKPPLTVASETISLLQKVYDLANSQFRHGMTTPFDLKPAEVDLVMVSCTGGILFFARIGPT